MFFCILFASFSAGAESCSSAKGVPLNESFYPTTDDECKVVCKWLETALVDSFSFGFNDYKEIAGKSARQYFTSDGKKYYRPVAIQMGQALQKRMLLQQFAFLEPPRLYKSGDKDGIYSWQYKVSGIISWSGVRPVENTKQADLDIAVSRSNEEALEYGLGISSLKVLNRK
jgi:hypothetical protein